MGVDQIAAAEAVWDRDTGSPNEGSTTINDDSETTVLDLGSDGDQTARELRSALLDVTLGSHGAITLAIKADINGTLTQIDSADVTSDGAVDLFEHVAIDHIASPHVQIAATGDTASPATNGSVDHLAEFSTAT